MKIIVNGNQYNDVEWVDNGFQMETDMTLTQIEAAFTPGANADIVVEEDDDQEIGRYYNKGISSIKVKGSDPRIVNVQFDLTQITPNAEEEIRGSIEDSDGAIVELAEIVSELSEIDIEGMEDELHAHQQVIDFISGMNIPGMKDELDSHQETLSTWFESASSIADYINLLREPNGILDQIDIRLKALEANSGIVSIVANNDAEEEEEE